MAIGFKHKGLKLLYERADRSKLPQAYVPKIERILSALDAATKPADLDLPGFGLHALSGDLSGHSSVSVNGNWRITFRFDGDKPTDVDLIDYH